MNDEADHAKFKELYNREIGKLPMLEEENKRLSAACTAYISEIESLRNQMEVITVEENINIDDDETNEKRNNSMSYIVNLEKENSVLLAKCSLLSKEIDILQKTDLQEEIKKLEEMLEFKDNERKGLLQGISNLEQNIVNERKISSELRQTNAKLESSQLYYKAKIEQEKANTSNPITKINREHNELLLSTEITLLKDARMDLKTTSSI